MKHQLSFDSEGDLFNEPDNLEELLEYVEMLGL